MIIFSFSCVLGDGVGVVGVVGDAGDCCVVGVVFLCLVVVGWCVVHGTCGQCGAV